MATTEITISKCDNELLLIASTAAGSSTLCHVKSGYNAPVSYEVNPQYILPSGDYTLHMIGINWGGPGDFEITVTTNGQPQTFHGQGGGTGVWSEQTQISI